MKAIKDYIGLYLNCDVFFDRRIWKMFKVSESIIHLKREGESVVMVYPHDAKPLLRRLENMTEEEKSEYNKRKQRKGYMAQVHADNTLWLLSKSFDLFHLIPAGLAIDKQTIKS